MKAIIVGEISGLNVYLRSTQVGRFVTLEKDKANQFEFGFATLAADNLNRAKFGGSINWKAEECC